MPKSKNAPSLGEIIMVDFSPTIGHEQKHKRPGVVISPQAFNKKTGLTLIVPITSKNIDRSNPFRLPLPATQKTTGVILLDHLRSMDLDERGYTSLEFLEDGTLDIALKIIRKIIPRSA